MEPESPSTDVKFSGADAIRIQNNMGHTQALNTANASTEPFKCPTELYLEVVTRLRSQVNGIYHNLKGEGSKLGVISADSKAFATTVGILTRYQLPDTVLAENTSTIKIWSQINRELDGVEERLFEIVETLEDLHPIFKKLEAHLKANKSKDGNIIG